MDNIFTLLGQLTVLGMVGGACIIVPIVVVEKSSGDLGNTILAFWFGIALCAVSIISSPWWLFT